MFETSVVQARARAAAHRPLLVSLSIGAHVAAVTGVVMMSVATVTLPTHSPNQLSVPIFRVPVVLPPRVGSPEVKKPAAAAPPQAVKRATTAPPSTVVTPTAIPDKVATVTPQSTGNDTGPITNNNGSDTPGPGDPNGSKNGVDGGILTDSKPPQVIEPKTIKLAKPPVVLVRVLPVYPPLMQKIRLNGFVILDCVIDPTGHVREAHVISSSNPAFEQSALDAIYQWQFQAGTMDGVPVNGEFELKVTFQIH